MGNSENDDTAINLAETSGPSPTLTSVELQNPRDFVTFWGLCNDLSLNECDRLTINLKVKDQKIVFAKLMLDYESFVLRFKEDKNNTHLKVLSKDSLERAFIEKLDNLRSQTILSIKQKLLKKSKTEKLCELERLMSAASDESLSFNTYLMAHWLQQVKRKLCSRAVENHLMVSFYGLQGCGKTELIYKLIKPLGQLASTFGIKELMDEKTSKALELNYVIFLDELMGIEKLDMEKFKKIITGHTHAFRPLYQDNVENLTINASFLAASNKPMFENFKDRTGLRRFAEIKTKDKMEWELINSIDYESIWHSIDLEENYFAHIKDQLSVLQTENIYLDHIDSFIEDYGISNHGTVGPIPIERLNQVFQDWAKKQGFRLTPTRSDLVRSLQTRCHLKTDRVRMGIARPTCLFLSSTKEIKIQTP